MARLGPAVGEDHGPGHVGGAAEELAVDEIGETAEEEADRRRAAITSASDEKGTAAAGEEIIAMTTPITRHGTTCRHARP